MHIGRSSANRRGRVETEVNDITMTASKLTVAIAANSWKIVMKSGTSFSY